MLSQYSRQRPKLTCTIVAGRAREASIRHNKKDRTDKPSSQRLQELYRPPGPMLLQVAAMQAHGGKSRSPGPVCLWEESRMHTLSASDGHLKPGVQGTGLAGAPRRAQDVRDPGSHAAGAACHSPQGHCINSMSVALERSRVERGQPRQRQCMVDIRTKIAARATTIVSPTVSAATTETP